MFQELWKNRAKYQVIESAEYFIKKIDKLCDPSWVPDQDDFLRCRVRTTGIIEEKYAVKNEHGDSQTILLLDVGGQRSERKKWIHCFQNVTGILFVAAISEFDQQLFEDNTINRVHESLKLFESIVNVPYFSKTSIILFLNKKDLFAAKLEAGAKLTAAFPEYPGDHRSVFCNRL